MSIQLHAPEKVVYGWNMTKNPYAVELAKRAVAKGAPSKGGRARARKLSAQRRREIARKAVLARWARVQKRV